MQTAEEAMTPIESTFSLDVNSKLDWWVALRDLSFYFASALFFFLNFFFFV